MIQLPGWVSPEAAADYHVMLDAFARVSYAATTDNLAELDEASRAFFESIRKAATQVQGSA